MEVTKPTVTLCHILLNVIDGGTQYFATPNEIDCEGATKVPGNALRTSLGIHPVEDDEPATLRAFLKSGYEVVLDTQYALPGWLAADVENCRWFAELNGQKKTRAFLIKNARVFFCPIARTAAFS